MNKRADVESEGIENCYTLKPEKMFYSCMFRFPPGAWRRPLKARVIPGLIMLGLIAFNIYQNKSLKVN